MDSGSVLRLGQGQGFPQICVGILDQWIGHSEIFPTVQRLGLVHYFSLENNQQKGRRPA